MERKVLLFGLLQSLSLLASADPDLNGTLTDNGTETDMASIEEYTRALPMMENPPRNAALNTDQFGENHLPFGALTTDWTRLHLLRDALPQDSVVKRKFKHLFRLLLVAYGEATRFSSSSESTKSHDTSESGTTVSVSTSKEGCVRKIDEKQPTTKDDPLLTSTSKTLIELSTNASSVDLDRENPSTSTSISNPIRYFSIDAEDNVDSVTMKNISQYSTGRDDEEKTAVRADIPDTESTGGGVEPSTHFDVNVGSSTETVLKETFDRPTTREDYAFTKTPSKTMTVMNGPSRSCICSGKGSERTQEEADGTFSHQSSTKTVPGEETSIVGERVSAATVSTSAPSRSPSSYSSSRENLATSMKSENVGSADSVTTNPKERYSTYEDYASTREENRSIELTPTTVIVETSEKNKSPLSVTNIPSEVTLSTEAVSSSSEKLLTTLSVAELYTDANVRLSKNSTESTSIDKERKNEETKPKKDTELVKSGKSTGSKQDNWDTTPRSTLASGSSTDSTNTRHYVRERSTIATVAKVSDLPRRGEHVNENDTSKDELTKKSTDEHVRDNTGRPTEESTGSRKATDKPNYIKNPLHAGSSKSNVIFKDFTHRPENVETNQSPESGGNVKSGKMWRPHIDNVPPVGNNIRRFDKAPENPRTYGYQRPSPSAATRANSVGESPVSSNKPRKRGSANADIEKLFRQFYTRGQIEPSNKSRSNKNDNAKITIQCKKSP